MIDWVIVISTAVGFMMASITKIGEAFATKAGEELFAIIKKKFKSDKEGRKILSDFQKKPARYQSALVDILKEKIEADKSFGDEIRIIVEKNSGNNSLIEQVVHGNDNIQAAGANIKITSKTVKR